VSDRRPRGAWDRARDWWWLLTVLAFVAGGVGGGVVRFTSWYIAEQNRATALKSLSDNSTLILSRLDAIDKTLNGQTYANQIAAQTRQDNADHLHALDVRADADRTAIADLHEQLATQRGDINTEKERVLYLLDPKIGSRR
jgi:hypothetical protein